MSTAGIPVAPTLLRFADRSRRSRRSGRCELMGRGNHERCSRRHKFNRHLDRDSSERPVHARRAPKTSEPSKAQQSLRPSPHLQPSQNKSSCARSCSSASAATRTRIASSTTLARVHLHRPQLRPLTPCPNARRSSTSAATARRSTSAARASSRSSSLSAARRPRASRRT